MEEKRDIAKDEDLDPTDITESKGEMEKKLMDRGILSMEQASFSWLPDSPVILEDISLSLEPGRLHMCVGPVASVRNAVRTPAAEASTDRSTDIKGENFFAALYARRNHTQERNLIRS